MKKGSQRAKSGNKSSNKAARDMPCASDGHGKASGWRTRKETSKVVIVNELDVHDSIRANVKTPRNQ